MMCLRYRFCCLLLLVLPAVALAQRSDKDRADAQKLDIINDRVEFIVESMTDEDVDLTTLFDDLD